MNVFLFKYLLFGILLIKDVFIRRWFYAHKGFTNLVRPLHIQFLLGSSVLSDRSLVLCRLITWRGVGCRYIMRLWKTVKWASSLLTCHRCLVYGLYYCMLDNWDMTRLPHLDGARRLCMTYYYSLTFDILGM